MKDNLDYLCSGGSQGYTVSAHVPNERPQMYKRYVYLPLEQTVLLAVNPILMITDERVLAHDVRVRQCYRDDERKLRFYRHYSIHNCRLECLSNISLARCGCVKYSMPRASFKLDFVCHIFWNLLSNHIFFRIKWYKNLWSRKG